MKKVILLVDDDSDYVEQMNIYLQSFGFETVIGDSQKKGEELIQTVKPDLAIFDLMMEQDDSGFVLAYKIKKKYPDVPVIIATAVSSETGFVFEPETNIEKSWIKADKYLEKGLRPDQLHREINKLLKL